MCFASAFRLVQNWWTQRRLKKEFGQKATDAFPQWEKDYNLQPMNTYGLFDEYLEMSMSLPEWIAKFNEYFCLLLCSML